MKQHITVEDLQKFNNEEQIKIATLFGQYGNCCNTGGESMNLGKLSERINIGKMLEILSKECKYINPMYYPKNWNGWFVDVVYPSGERSQKEYAELCDGLWEALKNVL